MDLSLLVKHLHGFLQRYALTVSKSHYEGILESFGTHIPLHDLGGLHRPCVAPHIAIEVATLIVGEVVQPLELLVASLEHLVGA